MATKLDEFPAGGRGGSRFPFDEWADGSVWQLTRGEHEGADFQQSTASMRAALYAAAKRRGMKVHTRSVRDGTNETLVVQFLANPGGRDDAPTPAARKPLVKK